MLDQTPPKTDSKGEPKPESRAWVNGTTIWFQVYRIASPGHLRAGQWLPITRTHAKTEQRAAMVRRILAARRFAGGK